MAEEEKSKKYQYEDLFKNNKIETEPKEVKENISLVQYKENLFTKILNRLKIILKRN